MTMYYLNPLIMAGLLTYCAVAFRRKSDLPFLAAFLTLGFLLAYYSGSDPGAMLIGITIFGGIAATLGSRASYPLLAAAGVYVLLLNGTPSLIAQAALLGFLSMARSFTGKNSSGNRRTEKRRDAVQIIVGAAILAVFAVVSYADATLFLLTGLIMSVLLSNYVVLNPEGGAARLLWSFERKNAAFGQGAMWLAIGALVAVSFLGRNEAAAVLGSIFIGDAVATIVGIEYGKTALPHNKKKSLAGSTAYFVSALLVSFPFIGGWAAVTALVAAGVESLPRRIDDNFDTAVALTVFVRLLGAIGVGL